MALRGDFGRRTAVARDAASWRRVAGLGAVLFAAVARDAASWWRMAGLGAVHGSAVDAFCSRLLLGRLATVKARLLSGRLPGGHSG